MCLSAVFARMALRFGNALLHFEVRRTCLECRRRPLLALGGLTLVLCVMALECVAALQRSVERWTEQLSQDAPALSCWLWLLRVARQRFVGRAAGGHAPQDTTSMLSVRPSRRRQGKFRGRTGSESKETSRVQQEWRWLELLQPWRRKRRERSFRRAAARKARLLVYVKRSMYSRIAHALELSRGCRTRSAPDH